jgi:hypothetical protein
MGSGFNPRGGNSIHPLTHSMINNGRAPKLRLLPGATYHRYTVTYLTWNHPLGGVSRRLGLGRSLVLSITKAK